jgi:hypothetical protein
MSSCFGGPNDSGFVTPVYVGPGIGLGTVIVVVSWSRNKSMLWAIIHGLLGGYMRLHDLVPKPAWLGPGISIILQVHIYFFIF